MRTVPGSGSNKTRSVTLNICGATTWTARYVREFISPSLFAYQKVRNASPPRSGRQDRWVGSNVVGRHLIRTPLDLQPGQTSQCLARVVAGAAADRAYQRV
jgi:hypothetical protein